jgi:hypothetical protein
MVWVTQEKKAVGSVPIVTVEGELPPGPEPEVPPITPVGPPIPGLKPAEVKIPEGFLEEHKAIKTIVDKAGYRYLCSTPEKIAEATGLSLEVVEQHLAVLEMDEAGKFLQGKSALDRAFCSVDSLQRLVENLRKLKV